MAKIQAMPADELKHIGMQDISLDDHAYIMATLPSNLDYKVPIIGFISHLDTSPDYTATDVKPQIHKNYDGKDIILNKDKNIVLSPSYFEDLLQGMAILDRCWSLLWTLLVLP